MPTPEPAPATLHQPGGEAADSPEAPARTNRLVPTNAVHTTKRRQRRANWHGQALAVVVAGAIIGLLVLGGRNEPSDVSPLERQSASIAAAPSDDADRPVAQDSAPAVGEPVPRSKTARAEPAADPASADSHGLTNAPAIPPAPRTPARKTATRASPHGLNLLELVEIERMLVRLDLNPSTPDGVVDSKTESAIRMYQQIAGLPEDGKPSRDLLDDMREVVKILDNSE
ncbi:MAG: peptidoglycan-binding protein [Kiloniellaceae bacterium]